MERTQDSQRGRQPKTITRQRQTRVDRRHHERVIAIAKFEAWDRAMQRAHGALYYRVQGYRLH